MNVKKGHCLCGRVTFEYRGPEIWRGHCHCESCRRATSSAFTTFFGVPRNACRFTGAEASIYRSSPGVRRMFCSNCGSPVAFESDCWPDETHFYAACLDDPADFSPEFHVHVAEKLPWVELADRLPQYERNAA
jgi:hypothetical protein